MKRSWGWILAAVLLLMIRMAPAFAEEAAQPVATTEEYAAGQAEEATQDMATEENAAEPAEEAAAGPAEWTVMFYLCGSDLESRHSFATGNLKEIAKCYTYESLRKFYDNEGTDPAVNGRVEVVIQTGGCREWHAEELGMEIASDRLQRWRYRPTDNIKRSLGSNSFELEEELPLVSMAAAETLADFIRWSVREYPAEKYALVLWDHGNGSRSGFLIDELFENDMMGLDELRQALAEGGVEIEAVIFDACLMAGIETAAAVREHARWMIASEDVVAGNGTAVSEWLQQLYNYAKCDGKMLGRWICDLTQIKYADEENPQAQATLTWSVIDLSKMEELEALFDRFFQFIGRLYRDRPLRLDSSFMYLSSAFEFGLGDSNMIDLSEIIREPDVAGQMAPELYHGLLNALAETVVYNVRGTERSRAGGLAFCYATDLDSGELDTFSRNCSSAHYLAFLDAISPGWEAPARVYEKVERLTDIRDMIAYRVDVEKTLARDGTPGLTFPSGILNARNVHANLYRWNEKTGSKIGIGSVIVPNDMEEPRAAGEVIYALTLFDKWPAIEGECCAPELVKETEDKALYNIPVRIGTETWFLRCGVDTETRKMELYGMWEGYEADSRVFNRNVMAFSQLAGREFHLLYPMEDAGESGGTRYESGRTMKLYRVLEIKGEALPEGTYELEYWVEDMFMRRLPVGRVRVTWDGKQVRLAEGETWEGIIVLN